MSKRLILALLILSAGAVAFLSLFFDLRLDTGEPQLITVMIDKGTSLHGVARQLANAGVVPGARRFALLGRLLGKSNALKWGEYEFQTPLHPIRVLQMLIAGEVKLYHLTVPEGFSAAQIGAVLESLGLTEAGEFRRTAMLPTAAKALQVPGPTLEGYLFPTTYALYKGMTTQEIQTTMVKEYRKVFDTSLQARAREVGLSERQVVTLAAIVEKETGVAEERPLIASVYLNRLKRGMRLQADPTVIYGIDNFDGNLTRRHLETAMPYNTYRIQGLPPGPIASPGAEAIRAVLYPATSDYLFFVANGNGAHVFSKDYEAHRKLVERYQLKRGGRKDRTPKLPQPSPVK